MAQLGRGQPTNVRIVQGARTLLLLVDVEQAVETDTAQTITYVPVKYPLAGYRSYVARTITAVLRQDQWGKYLVPLFRWHKPVRLSPPAVLPGSSTFETSWSPDGRMLAVAHTGTPPLKIYERSGTTFTKLADPASALSAGSTIAFSPDGRFLAEGGGASVFLIIYERSGTTFTKLADPASMPGQGVNGLAWSPDGRFLAVAHTTNVTIRITIYDRTGTTFTKVTNPATQPTGSAAGCCWSPDGRFLAVSHATTPFITIYERTDTTFTKLTDPGSLPAGNGSGGIAFSPDGRFLAMGHSTTPFITIYERSGNTFTKLPNPATLPGAAGGCSWSPDGSLLMHVGATVTLYRRFGSEFLAMVAPVLPTGNGSTKGSAWSPDGRFMTLPMSSGSTDILFYETSGETVYEDDFYLWMPDPGEL
jgi:Tol biopolymer transport system component